MCYQHLFKGVSGICAYWWSQIICVSIFIMSSGHTWNYGCINCNAPMLAMLTGIPAVMLATQNHQMPL